MIKVRRDAETVDGEETTSECKKVESKDSTLSFLYIRVLGHRSHPKKEGKVVDF